ncbi:MAG: ribonuclease catalytic domain-containing protein [Desulfomonilaceae bacterium]
MIVQPHDVIDYFDNKKISCAYVLEVEDRKLKIINENGKEIRISHARVLTRGQDPALQTARSRDDQTRRLKELSRMREEQKKEINIRELWEIVHTETSEIEIRDLSELCFGREADLDRTASLLRAIVEDKTFFKVNDGKIDVATPEQVDRALSQRKREEERAAFQAACAHFLGLLKEDQMAQEVSAPPGLIPLLEEAALKGADWTEVKEVKELFSKAGLSGNWDPFTVLVKLGVWDEDENVPLRSRDISLDFPSEIIGEAVRCASKPFLENRADLTHLHAVTIDSPTTMDIDDALSLSVEGDDIILGVHITDAAHFVECDSVLDQEVRRRAISLYFPDLRVPMIPPVLSEHAASLVAGEDRPVISIIAVFNPQRQLQEFKVSAGFIRVKERLTYEEVDARIQDQCFTENLMFQLASHLRKQRLDNGALIFRDPEINIRVAPDKTIEVNLRDREACSEILVSEFMILANSLFAKFLQEKGLPAIFRTQGPPSEKIEIKDEYDPVESYRCKKILARGDFVTRPAPHTTLGLPAYTTATSPLRRYTDLVVQRQIRGALGLSQHILSEEEIQKILAEINFRIDRAAILERQRQRYFLLKYLSQRKESTFEAIVLQRFPRFYLVYLRDFAFNAALKVPVGVELNPYDRVSVTIEKIIPREEKLTLALGQTMCYAPGKT